MTASRDLLRQLAIGLSVARLYPGDTGASAFVAAGERIQATVATALAHGPVRFEVRSGRMHVDGGAVGGEGIDRVAQACFERRVEHLGFDAVPTVEELAALFEVLSRDARELERDGGVALGLSARGVSAIRATAGAPETVSGEQVPEHLRGLADWVEAVVEEPDLPAGDLRPRPGESGRDLYERLAAHAADLPDDGRLRTTFYQRAVEIVELLAPCERAVFGRILIDRLVDEPFAERFAGHVTDVAFAELIEEVAEAEQRDPRALAAEVRAASHRHATLERLLSSERGEAGRVGAGRVGAGRGDEAAGELADAVAQAADQDRHLRVAFPADEGDGRELAARALTDVLGNQPRGDQLERLLHNVADQLGEAVSARDERCVRSVLDALAAARPIVDSAVGARFAEPRERALTSAVVTTLMSGPATSATSDVRLLEPFGAAAIAPLVEVLAQAPDRSTAERILAALALLAPAHPDVLQAVLSRHRPEVIARLVPVLAEAAGPDAPTLLNRLARHPDPTVQAAVVAALTGVDQPAAAPVLATVVGSTTQASVRRDGLQGLAGLPGRAGQGQLQALAGRDAVPVLPWRFRRLARRLARRMAGGS